MRTSQSARSRYMALISSGALWATALLIAGLIGGLWLLVAADSARAAMPLAAILASTPAVGIIWQRSRARAKRRLQTALDAYAEREIARAAQRRQRRRAAPVLANSLPGRDRLSA
jgi:hypothetical protein